MTPVTSFLAAPPDQTINAAKFDAAIAVFCAALGYSFIASIAVASRAHGGGLSQTQFEAMGFAAVAVMNFLAASWRAKVKIGLSSSPLMVGGCALGAALACCLTWLVLEKPQLAEEISIPTMVAAGLLNWRFSKLKVRADG